MRRRWAKQYTQHTRQTTGTCRWRRMWTCPPSRARLWASLALRSQACAGEGRGPGCARAAILHSMTTTWLSQVQTASLLRHSMQGTHAIITHTRLSRARNMHSCQGGRARGAARGHRWCYPRRRPPLCICARRRGAGAGAGAAGALRGVGPQVRAVTAARCAAGLCFAAVPQPQVRAMNGAAP